MDDVVTGQTNIFILVLFCTGSNYGRWSIAAYRCGYQGWSDWHEEPNAGEQSQIMFLV